MAAVQQLEALHPGVDTAVAVQCLRAAAGDVHQVSKVGECSELQKRVSVVSGVGE